MLQKVESKKFIDEVVKLNKRVGALLADCKVEIEIGGKNAFCVIDCPSEYHKDQIVKEVPAGEHPVEKSGAVFQGLTNAYGEIEQWIVAYKVARNEIEIAIEKLANEVHAIAKSKGWWDKECSFGEVIALIHSELSEALGLYREEKNVKSVWIEPAPVKGFVGKPEGIPIELADAIIRILDYCGRHDIDIANAILLKMEYNKTRPYRHGGKKI